MTRDKIIKIKKGKKLKPCPFCGSENLRHALHFGDDIEVPGIECMDCKAAAQEEYWNDSQMDALKYHLAQRENEIVRMQGVINRLEEQAALAQADDRMPFDKEE